MKPKTLADLGIERKPFYTPGEVAVILGVSDQNILDRIHAPVDDKQYLYAIALGPRTFRIPLGALLQLLKIPTQVRRGDRPALIDEGVRQEQVNGAKPRHPRKGMSVR